MRAYKDYVKYFADSVFVKLAFMRSIKNYKKFVGVAYEKSKNLFPGSNIYDPEKLALSRASDVITIIGSSKSLMELTPRDWDEIAKNDTFSLNFNIMLDLIPTYLMFEMPRDYDRKMIFRHWLDKKENEYLENDVKIILRGITSDDWCRGDVPEVLLNNCFITNQLYLNSPTYKSLKRSLSLFKKFEASEGGVVPLYKASLFSACYIAMQLGYSEIRLLGFDLNNIEYFYEDERFTKRPVPSSGQTGRIHKTALTTMNEISIIEAMKALSEVILTKNHVELCVLNKSSSLASMFRLKNITDD